MSLVGRIKKDVGRFKHAASEVVPDVAMRVPDVRLVHRALGYTFDRRGPAYPGGRETGHRPDSRMQMDRDHMDSMHPGFKKVQERIAKRMGVSKDRAGAILAAATRKASKKAKRKNPRLRRVQ